MTQPDQTRQPTSWSPERKIVSAAIAGLIAWGVQVGFGLDFPPGAEVSVGVVVGYFMPNKRS